MKVVCIAVIVIKNTVMRTYLHPLDLFDNKPMTPFFQWRKYIHVMKAIRVNFIVIAVAPTYLYPLDLFLKYFTPCRF